MRAGSDVAVVECPGGPWRVVIRGTADANLHVEDSVIQILEPGMFAFDILQMDRVWNPP